MDLTKLTKQQLFVKCKELGMTKYLSKNKTELISLLNKNEEEKEEEQISINIELPITCDEPLHIQISENITSQSVDESNFTIAETFVGCGGSHFGFKKSGFKTVFINDIWDDAIKSLVQNDHDLGENTVICDDIQNLNEKYLNVCV